jgi:hypothetical protein
MNKIAYIKAKAGHRALLKVRSYDRTGKFSALHGAALAILSISGVILGKRAERNEKPSKISVLQRG